ncbi:MAG TPA: nickel pincer cofactor biosynthesis protein LarC [Planctomycetes bacterium]|nr:nickel pincer cofactor biosynthesis protein LarC [Planctomycetota bacterium]
MPTLILDMPSGVAGDMLLAALLACGGDRERLERDLLALDCGPIRIHAKSVMAGPLAATQVDVDAEQEPRWIQAPHTLLNAEHRTPDTEHHPHRPYAAIRDRLARTPLPTRVIERAQRCFRLLAEAEGAVHGVPADTVEFHEVGSLDAIADVVGCCLLLEQLGIDRVLAGPIAPGRGTVRCAHGLMPVPVPAVAEMLKATGAPVRLHAGDTGELTTPTGCALVCALADAFLGDGAPLLGSITASGSGAGHKTIPGLVNAVRALVVEARPRADADDRVVELCANLDDMTGEDLALAVHGLLAAGALDAWTTPATMKKGRPGQILHALCRPEDETRLADLVLTTTSTIGLRSQTWARRILPRRTATFDLAGQPIRLKIVTLPGGGERAKPEADDVAAAAAALGRTVAAVRADLARCALP